MVAIGVRAEWIEEDYIDDCLSGITNLEDAAYMDVRSITLKKWIKQNPELPAHQIGTLWKFQKSELDEWVNSGKNILPEKSGIKCCIIIKGRRNQQYGGYYEW